METDEEGIFGRRHLGADTNILQFLIKQFSLVLQRIRIHLLQLDSVCVCVCVCVCVRARHVLNGIVLNCNLNCICKNF